ncbi:MAG: prolipoprotein diacylglyceryl transferase family protein [Acetobacteraceae bacterium]
MRPVLFAWGGIRFESLQLMLYLGLVIGVFAGVSPARERGLAPQQFLVASIVIVTAGFIGARLWHVWTLRRSYRRDRRRAWRLSAGDTVVYGAVLFALPVSVPVLAFMSVPFRAFWDAGATAALAGGAVGRFGCLLNGCSAGRVVSSPFALLLPNHRGVWRRRLPAPVLEILLCVVLLAGAAMLRPGQLPSGSVLALALIGYGSGSFFLEGCRERVSIAARRASALLVLSGAIGGLMLLA